MLSSIRRAYLNVDAGPSTFTRQPNRSFNPDNSEQWTSVRSLSNEERDQIDLQTRIIISKCAERVKQMEVIDKGDDWYHHFAALSHWDCSPERLDSASNEQPRFLRFLPSRLRGDSITAQSASLAAHHSSITYYLNRRLAEASQTQKEMQEERIRRQMERTRTLGSGAAREAADLRVFEAQPQATSAVPLSASRSWFGEAASSIASTIGVPSPMSASFSTSRTGPSPIRPKIDVDELDDEDDDDLELSSSQIQQFESENANILRSMQDTLASVQQAESRLMDISALQMELVAHLTKQNEITEQLYEDVISTTVTVEKGNIQLKEAKRRAKDSRLYILVFLLGASFALLFLHYYWYPAQLYPHFIASERSHYTSLTSWYLLFYIYIRLDWRSIWKLCYCSMAYRVYGVGGEVV